MTAAAQAPERRFTPADVARMVDAGILAEDEPVELLEGRLVIVSPQGPPHASLVGALAERLRSAYGSGHAVREEKPLQLTDSLPEPDIAVVRGAQADYVARHPGPLDVRMLVEVAVTSLGIDRDKTRIYARAAIATVWIVDVPARRIEVYGDPRPDGHYRVVHVLGEDDLVAPPGTDAQWTVRELLG